MKDLLQPVPTSPLRKGEASVHVRLAELRDIDDIVGFNAALAWESEGKCLDLAVLRRGVARVLATPTLGRYLVAEVQGQVIGQTMLTYELTDWRDGVIYWIQSVYVAAKQRQHGVFRQLYRAVQTLAAEDPHARGLRLYVEQANQNAVAVYESLGMKRAPYYFYDAEV